MIAKNTFLMMLTLATTVACGSKDADTNNDTGSDGGVCVLADSGDGGACVRADVGDIVRYVIQAAYIASYL